jgi:hypothetical protein
MVEMLGLNIGGTAGNGNGNVLFLERSARANLSFKLHLEAKTFFLSWEVIPGGQRKPRGISCRAPCVLSREHIRLV